MLRDGLLRALGERLLRLPRPAAWALVFAWYGLIAWGSSFPASGARHHWSMAVLSNGTHAPEFGLLAAWIALLVRRRDGWPDLRRRTRLAIVAVIGACGAIDELHQHLFAPGRDLSVLDIVTDLCGAALTLEIVAYLGRARRTRAGLALRLACAALGALACGAIATFLPRCFPDAWWF